MFLQMVLKTIAVLELAFPFVATEENGNNRILPLSELGEAKHCTRIVIRVVIAAVATDFTHLSRFFLHVFTFFESRVSFSAKAFSKALENCSGHQWKSNHGVTYHHDFVSFLLNLAPAHCFLNR
jgi:hypothetical protein